MTLLIGTCVDTKTITPFTLPRYIGLFKATNTRALATRVIER